MIIRNYCRQLSKIGPILSQETRFKYLPYVFVLLIFYLTACTRPASRAVPLSVASTQSPTAIASSLPSPEPTLTATPEIDICLYGKWVVQDQYLAAYLIAGITTVTPTQAALTEASGALYMVFNEDGVMGLFSEDYALTLEIEIPDSAFSLTVLKLTINAQGRASFAVRNGLLITYKGDYEAAKDAQFPLVLSPASITIAPLTLTPNNFFTRSLNELSGYETLFSEFMPKASFYQCGEEILSLEVENFGQINFTRTVEESP